MGTGSFCPGTCVFAGTITRVGLYRNSRHSFSPLPCSIIDGKISKPKSILHDVACIPSFLGASLIYPLLGTFLPVAVESTKGTTGMVSQGCILVISLTQNRNIPQIVCEDVVSSGKPSPPPVLSGKFLDLEKTSLECLDAACPSIQLGSLRASSSLAVTHPGAN